MNQIIDEGLIERKVEGPKFKILPIIIWSFIIIVGLVFKVMNWPGQKAFIFFGASGLAGYSISSFIILKGRNSLNNVFALLSLIWFLTLIAGAIFYDGYPINTDGVLANFYFFLIILLIDQIIKRIKNYRRKSTKIRG